MADLTLWKDKQLKQLKSDMDRMVKDFFRDFGTPFFGEIYGDLGMVDIAEEGEKVIISIELPGFEADDLEVSVSPESLIIGGLKKEALQDQGGLLERSSHFENRLKLPCRVEPDKVEASYGENRLKIVLPKCRGVVYRKITVRQSPRQAVVQK